MKMTSDSSAASAMQFNADQSSSQQVRVFLSY